MKLSHRENGTNAQSPLSPHTVLLLPGNIQALVLPEDRGRSKPGREKPYGGKRRDLHALHVLHRIRTGARL